MAKKQAQVFHFDLYGKREDKYDFLNENSIGSIEWTELKPEAPNFFFVNKNFDGQGEYEKGFKVDEIFTINTSGIKTHDDSNLVSFNSFSENNQKYDYRPFDLRNICFDMSKVVRPRILVMKHFLEKANLGLVTCRQESTYDFQHIFISKNLSDINSISLQSREISYIFPLYVYSETFGQEERTPNFNMDIVKQIEESLGLRFVPEKDSSAGSASENTFAPIDLLDYIYAVLHSPTYREKYKEFLKIDFPRVPYPKDAIKFWKLVELGGQIREIHLLESLVVEKFVTQYPVGGDNVMDKPVYKNGNVYINSTQYFANVPEVAWNFYIGGYQPAQKWLKDRKGRTLDFEDILHYQKIIVALLETERLMREIDKLEIV